MTLPHVITLVWLKEHDACTEEVEQFSAEYGESVTLTPEIIRAAVGRYNLDWLASHFLTDEPWRVYVAAKAEALIAALWPEGGAS